MKSFKYSPNFFIVGAPKSGTTSLYEYLNAHPDVLMASKKEPNFFSLDLERPRRMTIAEYLSLFVSDKIAQGVGEASATYLYSDLAPGLIKEFCPDARIIMILRNPVDMIYSLHAQHIWNGRENIVDFSKALAAEEHRREGRRLPPFPPPVRMLLYRDRGQYVGNVLSYIETFGRDRVKVLIFEEFVADTPRGYAEVCEFLTIDSGFYPDFDIHNSNKSLRSPWLRGLPAAPIGRSVRSVLPKPLRDRAKKILLRVNTKVEKRQPMDPSLRTQLEEEFRPGIVRLSAVLERNLLEVWKPSGFMTREHDQTCLESTRS